MAGFFGLFNYEKEGPGIDKNAPKKKTFIVFFETFFRNFWKFIPINLIYTLISLPVLTGGIAAVGITNVARNTARDKHSFGLSDFFDTIKKNWKQALPAGIINTVIYIVLIFDSYFFYNSEGFMSTLGLGISLSALMIFTMMNFYMWTLMITFKFSLKQIYINSLRFSIISLFKNFGCFFSIVAVYAVLLGITVVAFKCFSIKGFLFTLTIVILIYLLFYPSFKFLLIQYFTFPAIKKHIIDPYYAEHPNEDIERRKSLGLDIDEDDDEEGDEDGTDDEELIFND